jgi:ABC-type antimicrobial peptide transport system permease subunit
MALKGAALQLSMGIFFGVGCVLAWDRAFHTAGSIKISNPIVLISAAAMLALIAGVACLVPVLCAMRVNPVVALRYE